MTFQVLRLAVFNSLATAYRRGSHSSRTIRSLKNDLAGNFLAVTFCKQPETLTFVFTASVMIDMIANMISLCGRQLFCKFFFLYYAKLLLSDPCFVFWSRFYLFDLLSISWFYLFFKPKFRCLVTKWPRCKSMMSCSF